MIIAAVASRRLVLRIRCVEIVAFDKRHDGHACFESREAEGKTGEEQAGEADDGEQAAVLSEEGAFPVQNQTGLLQHVEDAHHGNDGIKREIDGYQDDGDIDRFFKTLEEDGAQDGEQHEGDAHLALKPMWGVGIVHKVSCRVRRRKGHGDDEVGGGETEQD